ncbi:hypothetical protein Fcan01_22848 [Folsomia candida]|uniref:DUF5648 domain-containing protein n=1 Tax=Folsomia candida TaxID=158441 RepID=A0A226DAA0_FOLCA|nr:hypothetical protein Fcan01_22848 [Folsomia candida]
MRDGHVFPCPRDGTVPLYRYYSSKHRDHHYTTNWVELRAGGDPEGYVYEVCYVFPPPMTGSKPFFRYFNHKIKDNFFTANWAEQRGGNGDWMHEGVAAYVL